MKNPRLSAVNVSAELNEKFSTLISPETVVREAGLHGCSAHKIYFISAKNRKLRFSFAKSMISKPETYWNNLLFADKSKFNILGSDGRITLWRRKNEEFSLNS